jgi:hypothetical protein
MTSPLEPIMTYQMTNLEAKAFKLSLLWEALTQKEFPEYSHTKLRKSGDPRKSILFKYCYKLLKETKGLLEEKEYKNYITSQLHVYKSMVEQYARIDPIILCGPKAWKRWKYWSYLYKKQQMIIETQDVEIKAIPSNVIREIKATRKFLFDKFDGVPTFEALVENVSDFHVWIGTGRISPYYVILSPYVSRLEIQIFPIELGIYRQSITPEIEKIFKIEFNYEF